jgi:hypothetical protein
MSKRTTIAGYTLAFLAVPLVLATFIGMSFWAGNLVSATGLKVSPWFSGGEVWRTVDRETYQTQIHKPVFDGLLSAQSKGFVQVDWTPADSLPEKIDEIIDVYGDGQAVFRVEFNTKTGDAVLTPSTSRILGLQGTYKLKKSWAIRVAMENPGR